MFSVDVTGACRLPAEELLRNLDSARAGLSGDEAGARLQEYGPNQLETRTRLNPLRLFFDQFKSFIIYILLFAVFFSLLIGEYVDSIIILAILMMNAVIGFCQELSAHKSLAALKKISTVEAMVLRDGVRRSVDASLLVPGDIVLLEAGDKVPAEKDADVHRPGRTLQDCPARRSRSRHPVCCRTRLCRSRPCL